MNLCGKYLCKRPNTLCEFPRIKIIIIPTKNFTWPYPREGVNDILVMCTKSRSRNIRTISVNKKYWKLLDQNRAIEIER